MVFSAALSTELVKFLFNFTIFLIAGLDKSNLPNPSSAFFIIVSKPLFIWSKVFTSKNLILPLVISFKFFINNK